MIIVFHNKDFIGSYFRQVLNLESATDICIESLQAVAIIDTNSLSEAFGLVQHLRQGWQSNPRIQTIKCSRNTVVGDVLCTQSGQYWLITLNGFTKIGKLPDNLLELCPIQQHRFF